MHVDDIDVPVSSPEVVSQGQNLPWGACPRPPCIRCAKPVKLIIIICHVETASHTGHCPINLVNVW